MAEVASLSPHLLLLLGKEHDRRAAALAALLAALLAATHAPLRVLPGFLCLPVMPGVLGHLAICGDEKHLESHVYARLVAGQGQRLSRHLSTAQMQAYQPSASREMVTVLGVPSKGRWSRRRMRPILERLSISPSSTT